MPQSQTAALPRPQEEEETDKSKQAQIEQTNNKRLLHNQVLENVSSAKYLGVQITDDLDWGQHISEITSKATKTLGLLRRNMAFAPRETKAAAYKTLVRPKLEYAAPVWMPHHQKEIDRIEKVPRTVARWTCRRWRNQSHVGKMLDELQWPTLQVTAGFNDSILKDPQQLSYYR